jgi:hypothetical protein
MDVSRVSRGEAIAAAGGLALLVFMFLPWFGGSLSGIGAPIKVPTSTGWESFGGVFDILIVLLAGTPLAIAVGRATDRVPPLPLEQAVLVMAAGALLALVVAVRLLDPPDVIDVGIPTIEVESSRKVAAFLALAAAALIAYGGYLQRAATRTA